MIDIYAPTGGGMLSYWVVPISVARTLLSWSRIIPKRVRHACRTHVSCIFFSICHVSICPFQCYCVRV